MKKIGFIDYYLDEWHANKYPGFFQEAVGDEMKVCYAYGEIDAPNGISNKQWSEKNDIELLDSIEEVVEKSDYIVVLSPDNPEKHVGLAEIPLKSGKPVYIDKTFSTSGKDAEYMFKNADDNNTPCYSSSALYFSDELREVDKDGISRICSMGPGNLGNYAVHQVEQIVYLMGYAAKRVMCLGDTTQYSYIIEFEGNRFAQVNHFAGQDYAMTIGYENGKSKNVKIESKFFKNCIKNMTEFFKTGNVPVSHEQTVTVMKIIEAVIKASKNPFVWENIC